MKAHILGYPRIGKHREMKKAVEAYWAGALNREELQGQGKQIRQDNWIQQKTAGLDFVTVNDFSWYDHMLDMATMLGVVPERFGPVGAKVDLDTYFRMARGRAPTGEDTLACEMTKWFDTNYHYIVPELQADQTFKVSHEKLFEEIEEAKALGLNPKPMLIGPMTFLWLSKTKDQAFDKLALLPNLLKAYQTVLERMKAQNVEWVQMDEPMLVLDLPKAWQQAFQMAYETLAENRPNLMMTTYFGPLEENVALVKTLPVEGWHLDMARGQDSLSKMMAHLPETSVLSLGLVNGRNVWRCDLNDKLQKISSIADQLKDRLWISSSCSLLHAPVDLDVEKKLDVEIKDWLAFARQKLDEIVTLKKAVLDPESVSDELEQSDAIHRARQTSEKIHKRAVQERMKAVHPQMYQRLSAYDTRAKTQKAALKLPMFPTTTIGSFPQTKEIRALRRDWKKGVLQQKDYEDQIKAQIKETVKTQEALNLDVLVHGEAERNDMVEYFGEQLEGYTFTENGWVQSYGSRCVKPPIIYGDVSRAKPMTVEWTQYAQSLTVKLMKGMLTGPTTMLFWSFVRDDQPKSKTASQIALALRDEINDLEKAGIQVIQLDEPAFREGLPLRQKDWPHYLEWSVNAFKLATGGVKDKTQVHTHMCYSEFNDVIESIAALDADVITIETSRSHMELLEAFKDFQYPNEMGPGVYDIHSPRVPTMDEMVTLLDRAAKMLPPERLWVNPDCGLKTRDWTETLAALKNMVKAAQKLREKYRVETPVTA